MDDNARFCPQCGCPAEEDVNVSAPKGEAKEQKKENRNLPPEDKWESNDKSNKTFVIVIVLVVAVAVAVGFSLLFAPLPVSTGVYSAPSGTADSDSTMVVTDCTSADSTVLVDATDEAGSNDAYVANESEKSATTGNSYAFEFVVSGTTYRITFNEQEGTAQLYVKGDLVPNGKTFYGYCQLDGLYHKGQINVSGFDGASDFNILRGNERASWSAGIWIDYKNNYLYITQDAARAYNPDYRIAITPVK